MRSIPHVSAGSPFPRTVTPRDTQALRAARFAESRTREAAAAVSADTYRILYHNPIAGVMVLRRRENPATAEGYTVNYRHRLTCTCWDMNSTLKRENRKCAGHGLCPTLLCKHILIAFDLALLGKPTEPLTLPPTYDDFMGTALPAFDPWGTWPGEVVA